MQFKFGFIAVAGLLSLLSSPARAQVFGVDDYYLSTHRMGAFQCMRCPKGGFIEGVRSGDHGRTRREFSSIQQLCVGKYAYIDGELYAFFNLDDQPWPDDGAWGLKANSWNAECKLR